MKDSIKKRIDLIKKSETPEELKKCLCPFFEKGGNSDCAICLKSEADLDECKEYYLGRILIHPMDIWSEEFDTTLMQKRDVVSVDDVVGVGSNCDNCYMYDKCPLYRKGYICGIEWGSNMPKTPSEFMDFLIKLQYERVKRSSVFEKLDGGVPDAGLSGEMDRLTDYLNTKDNMGRDRLSINLEASGVAKPTGGILSKLFGGGESSAPKAIESPKPQLLDVTEVENYDEILEEKKTKKSKK